MKSPWAPAILGLTVLLFSTFAQTLRADTIPYYAVLFSGGSDPQNNHLRYYTETLRMWQVVTGTLRLPTSNVYVLVADGTNPADDRTQGDAADDPTRTNSDWQQIVDAGGNVIEATTANLQTTLATIADKPYVNDFYFWSFDHGGADLATNGESSLITWGGQVWDHDLATWLGAIRSDFAYYAFAECFSGGMVDDLNLANSPNRFAAWASAWNENSYGSGWADAWATGLENGLRTTTALGTYASENDIYASKYGFNLEHPGSAGADFNVYYVPEPATLLLVFPAISWLLLRRKAA